MGVIGACRILKARRTEHGRVLVASEHAMTRFETV